MHIISERVYIATLPHYHNEIKFIELKQTSAALVFCRQLLETKHFYN